MVSFMRILPEMSSGSLPHFRSNCRCSTKYRLRLALGLPVQVGLMFVRRYAGINRYSMWGRAADRWLLNDNRTCCSLEARNLPGLPPPQGGAITDALLFRVFRQLHASNRA